MRVYGFYVYKNQLIKDSKFQRIANSRVRELKIEEAIEKAASILRKPTQQIK